MLSNEELIELEKKYFNILKDTISANLGKIISQICSQKLFEDLAENEKNNVIDTAVENIIEGVISRNLDWNTCSMPVRSDSCYECGDAIVHIDAKTIKTSDNDNKINVEKSQTTYDSENELMVSGKKWKPNLKHYQKHNYYGETPNLTYFVRVIYSEENLVESITLICVPNGQLYDEFGVDILGAGKSNTEDTRNNIRFKIGEITSKEEDKWRSVILFERKN